MLAAALPDDLHPANALWLVPAVVQYLSCFQGSAREHAATAAAPVTLDPGSAHAAVPYVSAAVPVAGHQVLLQGWLNAKPQARESRAREPPGVVHWVGLPDYAWPVPVLCGLQCLEGETNPERTVAKAMPRAAPHSHCCCVHQHAESEALQQPVVSEGLAAEAAQAVAAVGACLEE
jgi:hypothetical protein